MSDTRFFDGYIWTSDKADCSTGLCMRTTDPAEAARMFLSNFNRYWSKGKTFTVYTLTDASSHPIRHDVTF